LTDGTTLDIGHIKEMLLLDNLRISEPEYRVKTEQSGFFLNKKPQTREEFTNDLHKIHLVYEENGLAKGYLRIDEEQEMSNDIDTFWFKPDLKDTYFLSPHAALGGIGVLPEVAKKGVGTELLNRVIAEVRKKVSLIYFLLLHCHR